MAFHRACLPFALALLAAACGGKVSDVGDAASPAPTSTNPAPTPNPVPTPTPTTLPFPTDAGPVPTPVPAPTSTVPGVDAGPGPGPQPFDGGTFDATLNDASACVIPPGGEPCEPGGVQCGTTICNAGFEVCCVSVGSGGMVGGSCEPAMGGVCGGLSEACDETSDCSGGDVCCLVATSPSVSGITTQCMPSCQGGLFAAQLCRSDTECPSGQCLPQTCSEVGGLQVEACEMIPTCTLSK